MSSSRVTCTRVPGCLLAAVAAAMLMGCEYKPPPTTAMADAEYSGDIINSIADTSTGYVIGGSVARQWLTAEESVTRLTRRQGWWVYGLARALGRVDSGAGLSAEPSCAGWRVEFSDLGPKLNNAFAILGRWNGAPRKAAAQSLDHPAYLSVVGKTLVAHGIDTPEVDLTANLRIDLDDDGIDEVLLAATNLDAAVANAPAGGYSLILLRKATVAGVTTRLLTLTMLPGGCTACNPEVHSIGGLVDLNGDGNVEVIIRTTSATADGGSIFAAGADEPLEVFTWSCNKFNQSN